jgi:hypothetical protein
VQGHEKQRLKAEKLKAEECEFKRKLCFDSPRTSVRATRVIGSIQPSALQLSAFLF